MVRGMETVEPPVKPETKELEVPAKPKPSFQERMKEFVEQYGMMALAVYFAIFGLSIAVFMVLIRLGAQSTDVFTRLGLKVDSTAGFMGSLTLAYAATKLTQPVRIGIWFVVTPVIARIMNRRKKPAAS
jgi:hypothetical protein